MSQRRFTAKYYNKSESQLFLIIALFAISLLLNSYLYPNGSVVLKNYDNCELLTETPLPNQIQSELPLKEIIYSDGTSSYIIASHPEKTAGSPFITPEFGQRDVVSTCFQSTLNVFKFFVLRKINLLLFPFHFHY